MTMIEESFEGSAPKPPKKLYALSITRGLSPLFSSFVKTTEYARFAQMCDTCRQYQYVAICLGAAGVGKTCCARYYAQWEHIEPFLSRSGEGFDLAISPDDLFPHTAFYAPSVTTTPKQIERDLNWLRWSLQRLAECINVRTALSSFIATLSLSIETAWGAN